MVAKLALRQRSSRALPARVRNPQQGKRLPSIEPVSIDSFPGSFGQFEEVIKVASKRVKVKIPKFRLTPSGRCIKTGSVTKTVTVKVR